MSGIVGFLRRDGAPTSAGDLEPALAAMAARGGDARAVWTAGPVALGCLQRRTTPQSRRETLPYRDGECGIVVVHDARLDNREELAITLGLRGTPLDAVTDGALLAAAWARWGERCPERLLGDFAFAIWDERTRALFCARDHLGTRFLCCHASPALFVCASAIKGVLAAPGVPSRLNLEKVADFLIDIVPDSAATFYSDVVKLRPASRGSSLRSSRTRAATSPSHSPSTITGAMPPRWPRGSVRS